MLCLGCEEDLIDARVRCSMITVKGVITATTELLAGQIHQEGKHNKDFSRIQ